MIKKPLRPSKPEVRRPSREVELGRQWERSHAEELRQMKPAYNPSLVSSEAVDTMAWLAQAHGLSEKPHEVMEGLAQQARESHSFGKFISKASDFLDSRGVKSADLGYSLRVFLDSQTRRYRKPGERQEREITPELLKRNVNEHFLPVTRALVKRHAEGSRANMKDLKVLENMAKFYHFARNEEGPLRTAIGYLPAHLSRTGASQKALPGKGAKN